MRHSSIGTFTKMTPSPTASRRGLRIMAAAGRRDGAWSCRARPSHHMQGQVREQDTRIRGFLLLLSDQNGWPCAHWHTNERCHCQSPTSTRFNQSTASALSYSRFRFRLSASVATKLPIFLRGCFSLGPTLTRNALVASKIVFSSASLVREVTHS